MLTITDEGVFVSIIAGDARCARLDRTLATNLVLTWLVGSASLTWDYRKTTWLVILVGAAVAALRASRPHSGDGRLPAAAPAVR